MLRSAGTFAFLASWVAALAACSGSAPAPTSKAPPSAPVTEGSVAPPAMPDAASSEQDIPRQRGMSWVAGPKEIGAEHFAPLAEVGVDWIVQTPFGWQTSFDSPEIRLITGEGVMWGERDVGLEATARLAQEQGIATLLKPHIWLLDRSNGKWRTDIRMSSEEDWRSWFAQYRSFILYYAHLAERTGMKALAIGTELHGTSVERGQDWRDLIAEIRQVYGGQLTYAANWWKEYEEIRFWDALDFIGIQAYFPLTDREGPSVEDLEAGWETHFAAIEAVSRRYGKKVIFTEVGYKSTTDAAIRPWEWPDQHMASATDSGLETQARAYEAFFRTFWHRPWFSGAYFWKWFPASKPLKDARNIDFSPQGKPAREVLARWYRQPDDS